MTGEITLPFETEELIQELKENSRVESFEKDDIVVDIGQKLTHFPIVLKGAMRVYRDEDDHDLLLYLIGPGQTCAIGLKCCLEGGKAQVRAVADTEVDVLMVPVDLIYSLTMKYPEWFRYVITTFNNRIDRLFENIDDLAFGDLEHRIMKYLHDRAEHSDSNEVKTTHQEIANDLNSSREVISRVMKKLEKQGVLKTKRGKVCLAE